MANSALTYLLCLQSALLRARSPFAYLFGMSQGSLCGASHPEVLATVIQRSVAGM